MTLVDGTPRETLPVTDRGGLYGDGVFETIRFRSGRAPLWPGHVARLTRDATRLGIPVPAPALLLDECRRAGRALAGAPEHWVVRITLTRGDGPRGYAPPATPRGRRIVAAGPLADPESGTGGDGVLGLTVVRCRTPASANPALAGVKHLGRLDQVLAAREVAAHGADEGLLFLPDGTLVEAVSANVFLFRGGRWLTPGLLTAGVAGIYRQRVLDAGLADEAALGAVDVERAEAACLTNAVRGIRPVRVLVGRTVALEPARALAQEIQDPWCARA